MSLEKGTENKETSSNGYKINKTGLLYDPIMLDYNCLWDPIYPEKPDRIKKPFERCQFYGLTEDCINIQGRYGTDEEIEKCHTARVNQLMKDCEKMSLEELKYISTQYDSMYFHQNSNQAAKFALGCSIELLDHIMTGKVDNGFAIIRPPGHHAMHDEPNGYCYYNNASVVAKLAIEKYNLEKVLIVDWDVHHGQGTQYLFYDDPRVLYFSLHRYDFGHFWPNLRQSDFDYIGEKEGKGFNINIPLNKTGFGDSEYFASFFNLLLPIAYEYKPDLVIISSGYDAAIGCFEGRMRVTPAGYAHLINSLSCLSGGKLCVLLEGGYCIKSLSEGVALSVRGLLGYPCPRVEDFKKPDPVFVQTLMNLISVLRPYWKCLQNLNDDDAISLETFLSEWDKNHRKDIPFYQYDESPKNFPLTGFYPLYTDEENAKLDVEIDELIEKTDLAVPSYRSCFDHNLDQTLEQIATGKCTNGLVFSKIYEDFLDSSNRTSSLAIKKFERINKVLNIIFSDKQIKDLNEDSNVLNIVFGSVNLKSNQTTKNNIYLSFDQVNDVSLLTCFLRIVLPISYQFNPDFVLTNVDLNTASNPNLETSLVHVFKLLSSLANGNLILNFEGDSETEGLKKIIKKTSLVLNGEALESPPVLIPSETVRISIKEKIQQLKSNWDCFQFNEKLPK